MRKRVKDAFLGEEGTVLAGGSCPHAKPALKQKDVEVEPACSGTWSSCTASSWRAQLSGWPRCLAAGGAPKGLRMDKIATKKRGKGNAKGGKAKGGKGKKKRRNEGETETSAAGSAGKGRKKGACAAEATNGGQPAAGETAADILRKLQNMQGGEGASA